MSKRYDEAIEVTPDPDTHGPLSFYWRGRRYDVDQHLSSWREGAEWWQARRGPNGSNGTGSNGNSANGNGRVPKDRDCFRILARPAGVFATGELDPDGFMQQSPSAVYDLAFDRIKKAWLLARIWD